MVGDLVAVVLALVSLWLRTTNGTDIIMPWGLSISKVIAVLIHHTGWKGGTLSYRHRVGMLPDERGQ